MIHIYSYIYERALAYRLIITIVFIEKQTATFSLAFRPCCISMVLCLRTGSCDFKWLCQSFLPSAHSVHRIVTCAVSPSARPSVPPSLPLHNPQYSTESGLVKLLAVIGVWTLLVMGFLYSFSVIQRHFKFLWIHRPACFLDKAGRWYPSSERYFSF